MKSSFIRCIGFIAFLAVILLYGCTKRVIEVVNTDNFIVSTVPIVFKTHLSYGSMTDQEGNIYKTVTIGSQTWMAENLRTTKYRDMTNIDYPGDDDEWNENGERNGVDDVLKQ